MLQGKQMVEALNACAVRAACAGNHDFDFGVDNFAEHAAGCRFPWLMANVVDAASGLPLGGASPTALLEWQGVKVGLIGGWVDGRGGRAASQVGGGVSLPAAVPALEPGWQLPPRRDTAQLLCLQGWWRRSG